MEASTQQDGPLIGIFAETNLELRCLRPPSRGYIYMARDILRTEEGRRVDIEMGDVVIPDEDLYSLYRGGHEIDQQVQAFLKRHYPEYYVIPFARTHLLTIPFVKDHEFSLGEIARASGGMVHDFFLIDATDSLHVTVERSPEGAYSVRYQPVHTVTSQLLQEAFPEAYERLMTARSRWLPGHGAM